MAKKKKKVKKVKLECSSNLESKNLYIARKSKSFDLEFDATFKVFFF